MAHDAAEELRARRLRATPQRLAILAAFEGGAAEHLSADEIHGRASARVPGIGRGTVYSTVTDLTEIGLLASVGDQDPIRYEVNTGHHDHFRCRLCLRLFDVDVRRPSTARLAAEGDLVEDVTVVVDGVCRHCEAYGAGLRDGARAMTEQRRTGAEVLATLACARHETSLGPLIVGASSAGVVRIAFERHADFASFGERARSRRGGRAARERVASALSAVDALLAGEPGTPADAIDWPAAGEDPVRREVLESIRSIGFGERRSYHELATPAGSPYERGHAMGANPVPLLIACHRVTRGQEVPHDYVGGPEVRLRLQAVELSA